jgi:hypothetical protein
MIGSSEASFSENGVFGNLGLFPDSGNFELAENATLREVLVACIIGIQPPQRSKPFLQSPFAS